MAEGTTNKPTFAAYWLYRLDPAFPRLPAKAQEQGKADFLAALEARDASVRLRGVYSLVGLREDADLLFWVLGQDLDAIQRLAVALRHTGLGRSLTQTQTYIGVTTPARYDPEHQPAFAQGVAPKRFISLYPFVKTDEWYLLPFERRRELMAEHGLVGRRYAVPREKLLASGNGARAGGTAAATKTAVKTATRPAAKATAKATATEMAREEGGGVLASTVDAFGLGDYEFILANESDDPAELCAMMLALRATEVRRYTKQDTPIFLGRRREPAEALADL